jgi:Rieske Fe-S protein
VILATHVPVLANPILLDKLTANQTYAIGVSVPAGSCPDLIADDTLEPYHYYRLEPGGANGMGGMMSGAMGGEKGGANGRADLVIFGGEDHETGREDPNEGRFKALGDELGHWIPGVPFEVLYRWSGELWETVDGLPYIGPDPAHGPTFVATGFDGVGMTFGTLAGQMAHDWVLGLEHPLGEVLRPGRIGLSDVPGMAKRGVAFAASFIKDRLSKPDVTLDALGPGEGALIEDDRLGRVAAYRDEDGRAHTVSAICPHAGCVVAWNGADRTWDCPCHGSRFEATGGVLAGPAVIGLKPLEETSPLATVPVPIV